MRSILVRYWRKKYADRVTLRLSVTSQKRLRRHSLRTRLLLQDMKEMLERRVLEGLLAAFIVIYDLDPSSCRTYGRINTALAIPGFTQVESDKPRPKNRRKDIKKRDIIGKAQVVESQLWQNLIDP